MEKKAFDQREFKRSEAFDFISIEDPENKKSIDGFLLDISKGGMQVRTKVRLKISHVYLLKLSAIDEGEAPLQGEIRYSFQIKDSHTFASGIQFVLGQEAKAARIYARYLNISKTDKNMNDQKEEMINDELKQAG